MTAKVYLAGAITGLTADAAEDWRQYAKRRLAYTSLGEMDSCQFDNDGDGNCPSCAHGQTNPVCRSRGRRETGIVGFSPMRAKDYLSEAGVLSGRPEAYDDYVLSSAKGIMYRDSWDVRTADLIFVNLLGAEKASIGTAMEIGMAWALQKPVVVCMEESNIHNHAMLNTAAGWITDDLDYGLDIVKAILLPDGVKVAK